MHLNLCNEPCSGLDWTAEQRRMHGCPPFLFTCTADYRAPGHTDLVFNEPVTPDRDPRLSFTFWLSAQSGHTDPCRGKHFSGLQAGRGSVFCSFFWLRNNKSCTRGLFQGSNQCPFSSRRISSAQPVVSHDCMLSPDKSTRHCYSP